jgi:hypothetical protein
VAENLYLLECGKGVGGDFGKRLQMDGEPSHVRLATVEPLSNYGFPPGADGWVLGVSGDGVIVGSQDVAEVPHMLVPWQNIIYLGDGTSLAKSQAAKA